MYKLYISLTVLLALIVTVALVSGCGDDDITFNMGDTIADEVYSLAVYKGDLYAAGFYGTDHAESYNVKRFTGTTWATVASALDSACWDICAGDSGLYASGIFTSIHGVPANRIARWDGAQWHPMGTGIDDGHVYDLLSLPNQLAVGGDFSSVGGSASERFAVWLESSASWATIAYSPSMQIEAMTSLGSTLYTAGNAPGGNGWLGHIFRYTGTWNEIGVFNGPAFPIQAWNNQIVVGGEFDSIGNVAANNIAAWNGQAWSPLGTGLTSGDIFFVNDMVVYNNSLIVGGMFETAGGVLTLNIARWDGTWHALGAGLKGEVWALAVHNGTLVAGGHFKTANNTHAGSVARWDGANWSFQ